jgi:hypothetical protein
LIIVDNESAIVLQSAQGSKDVQLADSHFDSHKSFHFSWLAVPRTRRALSWWCCLRNIGREAAARFLCPMLVAGTLDCCHC